MSSQMPTQRALLLRSKLGSFELDSVSIPSPGPGEVLLKVHSAGLNPVDVAIQKTGIFVEKYPAIIGCDIAGEVVSLGRGVKGFEKGDRLMLQGDFGNKYGGFQQYVAADANTSSKIPRGLTYDDAATVPLTCATAYLALCNEAPLGLGIASPLVVPGRNKNTSILILGGASGVGHFAIQFAKLAGFNPIITTASSKHNDSLLSTGATHVVDRHLSAQDSMNSIRKISSDLPYVFDAISSRDTQFLALNIVGTNGKLVLVRPSVFEDGAKGKNVSHVQALKSVKENQPRMKLLWSKMEMLLESKKLAPMPYEVVPGGLEGITRGLRRLEEEKVSGCKLLVHPQETSAEYN